MKVFFLVLVYVFELFFCKKIPLSQRVRYVMGGSVSGSVSGSVNGSVSASVRDVCHTNQIGSTIKHQSSFYKGKWYVRRYDPDKVENGHIYSSVKEEEVFIYWVYPNSFCRLC